jgi:hypothetical protein
VDKFSAFCFIYEGIDTLWPMLNFILVIRICDAIH